MTFPMSTFVLNITTDTHGVQPNDTLPQKFQSKLSTWEDSLVAVYLLLVSLLAFVLNTMVLYTCITNWSRLALHDLYIVNLALCDVLVPVFAFPLTTISSFYHRWVFLEIGCEIYGFLCFFFGVVSIITLTEMALVRYTIICRPAFDMTCKRKSRALLILPYIYAALWSAIPFVGYGSYEVESYGISCSLHWADNRVFTTLVSVCCIGLPAGCIVMAYGSILSASKRSRSKVKEHQKMLTNTHRKREAYLTKITFAMCLAFLGCWMPYAVVSMWAAYGNPDLIPLKFTLVAVLIAKSSIVINPVIYFLLSRKFRPMLRETFHTELVKLTSSLARSKLSFSSNNAGKVNNVINSKAEASVKKHLNVTACDTDGSSASLL